LPQNVTTTFATVPAGETWILKSGLFHNYTGTLGRLQFHIEDAAGVAFGQLIQEDIPSLTRKDWEGFVIAVPGDKLVGFCSQTPMSVWLSGAKLDGVRP
jgi:hypothetical protein